MNKTTKTTVQFILASLVFVAFAVTSCNNSKSKTESTESTVTPPPVTPPVTDSSNNIDTGDVKPTPTGN